MRPIGAGTPPRHEPSATVWVRLEPRSRDGSMAPGLQAQVRDPLWMLARQWQVGEFAGHDGGSPVQATMAVESRVLTAYSPGPLGAGAVAFDQGLPLEAHVEREAAHLDLRGRVQLGLRFEAMARAAGAGDPDLALFRQAFQLPDAGPDPVRDVASEQFRSLSRGRVTDGEQLYQAIVTGSPALPSSAPWVAAAVAAYRAYRESLYSEPAHDPAWSARDLRYDFSVASAAGNDTVTYLAPGFPGGHLDWYSFSPAPFGLPTGSGPPSLASWSFLPRHVTFRGMPGGRWWDFEDGQTDFGQLDAEHVDLAKLLVMEFALVYGGDWFQVPVPQGAGSLSRVETLVVSDTFSVRTLIRPTEAQVPAGERPWSMFKVAEGAAVSDWLFLPPVLGPTIEGPPLEEVLFLRDEMAAMAWGVEKLLQGPLDAPVDGYEAWRLRLLQDPGSVPPPPQPSPGGPAIYYLLETTVPDNWIPLVPVRSPSGRPFFRRGLIYRPALPQPQPIVARGRVLEPWHPLFVTDVAVPRAGADVVRRFRRTRWTDGSVVLWMARQVRPGRGPGWSGLAYDVIEPVGQLPPEISP